MTEGVKWVVGGILAVLVTASILIRLLPHHPPPSHIELKRRVQSWWVMVTVFSLSHAAFLLSFNNGAGLLLYLVVLTQLNDVAQFISGKAFGNRKIAPKVSPNKT